MAKVQRRSSCNLLLWAKLLLSEIQT